MADKKRTSLALCVCHAAFPKDFYAGRGGNFAFDTSNYSWTEVSALELQVWSVMEE